jgi:hypothetical protein
MSNDNEKVKRVPVAFRYDALNPAFLKCLAEIGHYAAEKYGSWEQYSKARLTGEKGPINHIYEHIRQYVMGEPYDHFDGDIGRHLVAGAYNFVINPRLAQRRGGSFREDDVEHAIQPVSCFAGCPTSASPPQAVPSDSHGRAESSQH